MKHTTSAQFALLAVLGAAATTASAQSSVALYGLIDATFMAVSYTHLTLPTICSV